MEKKKPSTAGMSEKEQLEHEIDKWTGKILEELEKVKIKEGDEKAKGYMKNIEAYISDSSTFKEGGKLVYSFEAIVWAWAWLSILKELEVF